MEGLSALQLLLIRASKRKNNDVVVLVAKEAILAREIKVEAVVDGAVRIAQQKALALRSVI